MLTTRHRATCALIALALLVSACGSESENEPAAAGGSSGSGDEIVIANVSATTGDLASTQSAQQVGTEAWVEWVNANGGIDGRQVRLITADSGSDAATEASLFTQLVESEAPIAFVGNGTFNLSAAASYLEEVGVPVVGGQISDVVFEESQMMFSQGASKITMSYGMAQAAEGSTIGIVYCSESAGCTQSYELLRAVAPLAGTELAYSQKLSLATADFTATCLAAREAGVEYMTLSFNTPNYLRFAEQCARQGFEPTYLMSSILPDDEVPSAPGMEDAIVALDGYPWWEADGAGAEFHAAMEEYFPDHTILPSTIQGWTAGILFQTAAERALADDDELNSATLIAALQTLEDEDLGGLSADVTFGEDSHPVHRCWFRGQAENGEWVVGDPLTSCVPDDVELPDI